MCIKVDSKGLNKCLLGIGLDKKGLNIGSCISYVDSNDVSKVGEELHAMYDKFDDSLNTLQIYTYKDEQLVLLYEDKCG